MLSDSFYKTQFNWFTGVVEDINDPEEMGRVRVRCFGYHTDNKIEIPTASLPWATPVMPFNSASMSGIGMSATGILQGSWVVGFFRDGPSAQDPVVIGTVPSRSNTADTRRGFSDPTGANPRAPGEVDTPKPARSEFSIHRAFTQKADTRVEDVETASPPRVDSVAMSEADAYYRRKTWSVPHPQDYISPIYPFNHVHETQSGHVIEMDDTPGATRLSRTHSSGSSETYTHDGSRILTVLGKSFKVVFSDENVSIRGSCSVTIEGDCRQLIKGNYHLEVEGNYTECVKGSVQRKVNLSEQVEIGQDRAINVGSRDLLHVSGDSSLIIKGDAEQTFAGSVTTTIAGDSLSVCGGSLSIAAGSTALITSSTGITITSPSLNLAGTGTCSSTFGTITMSGSSYSLNANTLAISGSTVSIDSSSGTTMTSGGEIVLTDANPANNSSVT